MISLVEITRLQKKTALICSSTNPATNNICERFVHRNNEKDLVVRLPPECCEISAVSAFDPERPRSTHFASVTKKKPQRGPLGS